MKLLRIATILLGSLLLVGCVAIRSETPLYDEYQRVWIHHWKEPGPDASNWRPVRRVDLQLTATLQRAYWLVLEVDPTPKRPNPNCWLCTSTLFASATRFWRSLASTSRQAIPSILTRFPPGALPFAMNR